MSDFAVDRGGFELRGWVAGDESGERAILAIHETVGSSQLWRPLAGELTERARFAAYDRRGWARSGAPDDYRRTTISEQAADAIAVIDDLGGGPVTVCGAGIGAVIALELAVQRRDLVEAAVLIEPPLLALVPEATPAVSADVEAIRRAVTAAAARLEDAADPREAAAAAASAAHELFLGGNLGALGAGAERIPRATAEAASASRFALFAEVAAISAWTLPVAKLPSLEPPVVVIIAGSTPPFVRLAAEALAARLPGADLRQLAAAGLPQLDSSEALAAILSELT